MRTLAGSIESSSAPVRDVRGASRRLAAILLPIGPAAVALLRFVLPYFTTDQPAAVAVAAAPVTQSLVLWLGFVAVLTLIPGVLAAGRLTRRYLPRLTAVALFLLVPGYISLAWLFSGDLLLWSAAESGLQAGTAMRLYETVHPTSNIAAGIFVLGHVIGTIILGIAMLRSRAVPAWAAVLTIISQPLHFIAAVIVGSPGLDLAAWGMNAVGFAAASAAILRLPDDQWDLGPQGIVPGR